jgi:hypothetical protein
VFHSDVAWQRRFIRINYGLHYGWAVVGQSFAKHGFGIFRSFDRKATRAASFSECRKVNRLQLDSELRITFKGHLFPLDHTEHVVLNNDDLHR